jgi:hypothetical protein
VPKGIRTRLGPGYEGSEASDEDAKALAAVESRSLHRAGALAAHCGPGLVPVADEAGHGWGATWPFLMGGARVGALSKACGATGRCLPRICMDGKLAEGAAAYACACSLWRAAASRGALDWSRLAPRPDSVRLRRKAPCTRW